MARKKKAKRKTKRKATPAQLRALAKGRATLRKKRRKKTAKKTRRRNPAFSNYQKARSVARGSRRVNKVRRLSPLYVLKKGAAFFDGARFSKAVKNAARYVDLGQAKRIARKLADATGQGIRIVDLRK